MSPLRLRSPSLVRSPAPPRSPTAPLLAAAVLAALPAPAQQQFADLGKGRLPQYWTFNLDVALADVDGDGDLDLGVGTGGQNRLYLNDGRGWFTDVTTTSLSGCHGETWALGFGDIDGDGDLDLITGNGYFAPQQNGLCLNDGTGVFTDVTATRMPTDNDRTSSLAVGDVDGDGDLDLVFGNAGQNRLYLNDGNGTFTDHTAAALPVGTDATMDLSLGDVDGDGDLDLIVGNGYYGPQHDRLLLNDGGGTFTDVTATRMPTIGDPTCSIALGDVDGDGDLDLAAGVYSSLIKLCLNDGNGLFTDVSVTQMPPPGFVLASVAFGDVDADGDLDLVVGEAYQIGAPNGLLLNDGAGTFTDAASRMPPDQWETFAIALGDVDGDRDLDLVCTEQSPLGGGAPTHLYLNLLRQLDAPGPLQTGQPYALDVYARYDAPSLGDLAIPYAAFRPAAIPAPPLGTVGLDPRWAAPLGPVLIPQPAGVGTLTVQVPNQPAFAGTSLYCQALLVRFPLQNLLTNVTHDVLQ